MTLAGLNSLSPEEFVETLGGVFEDSPWVAQGAWGLRPFRSLAELHDAMRRQVEDAAPERQLALLRAHPDLGSRASMSETSAREQSGAGLNRLTLEDRETLLALNREYRERFGFPFLLAVKGFSDRDIVEELRRRIGAPAEQEFQQALAQVYRIALFRLEALIIESR